MKNLAKNQKQELKKIAEKYKLNFLALFGSRAIGLERKDSDYDIAYSPQEEFDYDKEYFLSLELARVFKSFKIDMVSTKNSPPLLMREIAFNSKLLYEKEKNSFDYFQMYAFKIYVEAKPLFKMTHDYVNRI
jgi:predicted nucleotidyltransferase